MHPRVLEVTRRIQARSAATRQRYLEMVRAAASKAAPRHPAVRQPRPRGRGLWRKRQADPAADEPGQRGHRFRLQRHALGAPAVRALSGAYKTGAARDRFGRPVRRRRAGHVRRVTQGEPGMELSLASRDVIAMSTAIALSHNMFDAALCLGVCDKIVPGLLIGSLRFGPPAHRVRPGRADADRHLQQGKGRGAPTVRRGQGHSRRAAGLGSGLLPCTRHLHLLWHRQYQPVAGGGDGPALPGASFVNPNTCCAELTREARQASRLTPRTATTCRWRRSSTKAIVNSVVALLATGGSTNHPCTCWRSPRRRASS